MSEKEYVVFTIARMNPPTPGHMRLMKELLISAIKNGGNKVGILLSNSAKDRSKDPLFCPDKLAFVLTHLIPIIKEQLVREGHPEEKVDALDVKIKCMLVNPVSEIVNMLSEFGFPIDSTIQSYPSIRLRLLIGSDRAGSYKFEKYFPSPTDYEVLSPLQRTDFVGTTEISSISATMIRNFVRTGDRDTFMRIYQEAGVSEEVASKLYDDLASIFASIPVSLPKKVATGKRVTQSKRAERLGFSSHLPVESAPISKRSTRSKGGVGHRKKTRKNTKDRYMNIIKW